MSVRIPELDDGGASDQETPLTEPVRLDHLAGRYRGPLRRFFERRLRANPDPEDLVQEVFVRLIRYGKVESIRHLDGFVFRVAANVLRDHLRRWSIRANEVLHEQLDEVEIEGGITPERILLGEEAIERLIAALCELPQMTKAIFCLYHFDGVSQVDIAYKLSMSLSTLEKHMRRANVHLLRRLETPT